MKRNEEMSMSSQWEATLHKREPFEIFFMTKVN